MEFKEFLKEYSGEVIQDSPIEKTVSQQKGKRKQVYKKYIVQDNTFKPVGEISTEKTIPAGIYRVESSMTGIFFEIHDMNTDEILRFKDSRYNKILDEINTFWNLKEDFKKYGFSHKRGILLFGVPGSGKSCLLKLAMEEAVENDNIVLITKNAYHIAEGLKMIREVEPDRRILVVIEDIDEIVRYDEHTILELFDGNAQETGVLFLATTNYIDRLPPRINRAGRFDRKIEVAPPLFEGRYAYLKHKLGEHIDDEKIRTIAKKTDGFTFAQLREFVVSVFCLKDKEDDVIERIVNNLENYMKENYSKFLDKKVLLKEDVRDEDIEADEEDCFITDNTRGGYDVSCGGKFVKNAKDIDDALVTVKNWKEKNNYFPTTWFVSDHGNKWPIDDEGNEIK